jgi:hypothetical protein
MVKDVLEKELDTVDLDYEQIYWPGGATLDTVLPIRVDSGAVINAGTIVLRRIPYYRLRVLLPAATCAPGDRLSVGVAEGPWKYTGLGLIPCDEDFWVRGFAPGAYKLEIVTEGRSRGSRVRGAAAFDIQKENRSAQIALVRGVDVDGQVTTVEGAWKMPLDTMKIFIDPVEAGLYADEGPVSPDESGKFKIVNAMPAEHRLKISGVPSSHYVKEVRYNGIALRGNMRRLKLVLEPSAVSHSLEIVVDDKPATITGSVTDRDRAVAEPSVVLVPWPLSSAEAAWPVLKAAGDEDGKFKLTGLAPGEYRIVAVSPAMQEKLSEPGALQRLLVSAKAVELGPGALHTVPIELTEVR